MSATGVEATSPQRLSETAFIALGSNLGDREAHLAFARSRLAALPGTSVLAASDVEETEPLGGVSQPRYLNQMVALETALAPRVLLERLHEIERARGRVRAERWGSRTLDLDLVLYDDVTIEEPDLTVPHPGLRDRGFWRRQLDETRARLTEGR
jgi:2-amino-4-hydroxy-6-hydroxymethyldihydropteridine diphosphokinase